MTRVPRRGGSLERGLVLRMQEGGNRAWKVGLVQAANSVYVVEAE